ncbi:MAG: hypothetical protein K0Q66_1724 [Chitinophagaceae bacterium]|jgi:hypothetical protein|nr:hypothetical protein [Chitinophagaceae bacterium]
MRQLLLLALFVSASFTNGLQAQSTDPWITKAYKEIYNKTPNAEESKISNYNNGSWGGYCELVSYIVTYNNAKSGSHIKGDPWIFKAYCELYNRVPTFWETNIKNYNNGSWSSYDELKKFIQEYFTSLSNNKLEVKMAKAQGAKSNELAVVFVLDGKIQAANLIGNDAGSLLAIGGEAINAKGVTKLIGMDGATLIGMDGATLKDLAGVQFLSGYTVKSGDGSKTIKTSGKTSLVIKK